MKKSYWKIVVIAIICSLFGAVAGVAIMNTNVVSHSFFKSSNGDSYITDVADEFNQPKMTPAVYHSGSTPDDFVEAAERSINGVVNITSEILMSNSRNVPQFFDPFEFFFGIPSDPGQGSRRGEVPKKVGIGSGVIISTDGYIITNNHVISGASKIVVNTNDNREYEATIIGTDPATDIALIKIDATGLQPIPFGNSETLKVGEWVLAIGNPFNLTSTVTAGIVSAKGRSSLGSGDLKIASFIQTDAAVNPGNSGGALVNTRGELVGINTMIYSQTGNYAGYSFAVPVSIASKVVADIKKYGAVQRAVLGVVGTNICTEVTDKYDLKVSEGAVIVDFASRSSAKAAGLKEGDVITAINETPIRSMGELQEQVNKYSPGDKVNLTVNRKGKVEAFKVILKNSEGTTEVIEHTNFSSIGATFKEIDKAKASRLQISYGVEVNGVDNKGKFAEAGIQKGFVILAINNIPTRSVETVEKIINEVINNATDKVLFIKGILPNGRIQYIAVEL